jgi:hypothetical protein
VSTRSSTADLANIRHMPDRIPDIDAYDTARMVGVREWNELIDTRDCFLFVRSGVSSVARVILEIGDERGRGGADGLAN